MIRQVWGIYFSPCGDVEKVIRAMAAGAASRLGVPVRSADITRPMARRKDYPWGPEELVFVGVPVYAGRVPNKLAPFLGSGLRGTGPAVPVVCFGNRSFDDALSELYGLLRRGGFAVPAAAAAVCQHAFTPALAPGRPTGEDLARAEVFAVQTAEKLLAADGAPWLAQEDIPGSPSPRAYYQPLGLDGAPVDFLKATPTVDYALCNHCGTCGAVCPMGSVDRDDPGKMTGICIKCQACIQGCKRGARSFTDSAFLSHRAMLEQNYRRPAEPVFIL